MKFQVQAIDHVIIIEKGSKEYNYQEPPKRAVAEDRGFVGLSRRESGDISETWVVTWGVSWGVEGNSLSSDCFVVLSASSVGGGGRVGKSQGRGTYTFQLVSKYRQLELATLPRLQA